MEGWGLVGRCHRKSRRVVIGLHGSGSVCIRTEEKPEVLQLPRGKWRGKRIEVLEGSRTLFKD